MNLLSRKLTYLQSLLLLVVYILPQEAGSQASRPREGCFNSTPDLGMARGTIPDSDITASSMINSQSLPRFARLGNSKAWIADRNDLTPWIQVNLQKAINVTAIATQGLSGSYVRQYYLSYSVSGNQWMNYITQGVTKVFQANQNDAMLATVFLNPLVIAQYIRLHPTNCSKFCALRMELYGCNSTAGPSAPTQFNGQVLSATSVFLSWRDPDSPNGIIKKYLITTYETVTGREVSRTHVNLIETPQITKKISYLKPFTNYTFAVQAVTTEAGEMANFSARTEEGVPSKPINIKAKLEDGSITVAWEEPADPNGIITSYEVYCEGIRSYNIFFQTNYQISKPSTARFAVFSKAKLSPGTNFTIYVTAFTVKGGGDKSDHSVVETPSTAPPSPPPPLVVDDVTPTTITVSVMLSPDVNGKVIAHQVVVEKLGKVIKRSTKSLGDNIFGYEEAKENGDKLYVAARFDRGKITNQADFVLGDGKTYGGYENVPLEPETNHRVYVRGITENDGKLIYGDAAATILPTTAETRGTPVIEDVEKESTSFNAHLSRLRKKHGRFPQFKLQCWARMLVNGIHKSVTGKSQGFIVRSAVQQPATELSAIQTIDVAERKVRVRSSILQQLKELKALSEEGILSESEFASQKQKLLQELKDL